MRILHCNTYDTIGGAAIAARRIHNSLLAAGLESRMFVQNTQTGDPTILRCKASIPRKLWNKIANKVECIVRQHFYTPPKNTGVCSFNFLPWGYTTSLSNIQSEIMHLHWINERFLLSGELSNIRTPIVWTLHDQWPMTGGCHYTQNCRGLTSRCGNCPQLGSASKYDLSRLGWHLKNKAIKGKNIHIVCPSKWLARVARESSLLQNLPISVIPYSLPIDIFRPIDKTYSRQLLKIPEDNKPLLAFGAVLATSDARKGYDLFKNMLDQLPQNSYRCLIFGACAPIDEQRNDTIWLGRLHDEISLALAYNAADMFICPSREDNLPNTVLESLACGTPVIGFNIGGLPDMINHGEHGFLATPYDTIELAYYIQSLLGDTNLRQRMGYAAREKTKHWYAPAVVARQYLNLYQEILTRS